MDRARKFQDRGIRGAGGRLAYRVNAHFILDAIVIDLDKGVTGTHCGTDGQGDDVPKIV